jgi:hypothetical protein
MIFDRMLIQTHGDHGLIWFGNDQIFDDDWRSGFGDGNYDKLFPTYARIYFDWCDVAEGGIGVEFLRAAGRVFLKGMGGEVIGWTSFECGLRGWIPFVGGHTVQYSGHIVRVRFAPGDLDGKLDARAEVFAVGNQGLDASAGRVAGVGAGDGLVFSQVEDENAAGGRGGRSRGRHGKLR